MSQVAGVGAATALIEALSKDNTVKSSNNLKQTMHEMNKAHESGAFDQVKGIFSELSNISHIGQATQGPLAYLSGLMQSWTSDEMVKLQESLFNLFENPTFMASFRAFVVMLEGGMTAITFLIEKFDWLLDKLGELKTTMDGITGTSGIQLLTDLFSGSKNFSLNLEDLLDLKKWNLEVSDIIGINKVNLNIRDFVTFQKVTLRIDDLLRLL